MIDFSLVHILICYYCVLSVHRPMETGGEALLGFSNALHMINKYQITAIFPKCEQDVLEVLF